MIKVSVNCFSHACVLCTFHTYTYFLYRVTKSLSTDETGSVALGKVTPSTVGKRDPGKLILNFQLPNMRNYYRQTGLLWTK